MTAGTILSAVLKPPIARISDVAGRAETYVAVVIFYIISYILCASAQSFAHLPKALHSMLEAMSSTA